VLQSQLAATDQQIYDFVSEFCDLTTKETLMNDNDRDEPAGPPAADEGTTAEENGDAETPKPDQATAKPRISKEWQRKNARRLDLIDREFDGGLTPEEKAELEELQETVFAYFDTVFPRSWILDDDRLDKLEERYKNAENS
jgi:hypothetical protein